jgi:DNA modification methylase
VGKGKFRKGISGKGSGKVGTFRKAIEPCILAGCPRNGLVLDPFFGSGTTGVVASRHCRHYIGIELNQDYVKLAEKRLEVIEPLLF